jgi:hypothetical protein
MSAHAPIPAVRITCRDRPDFICSPRRRLFTRTTCWEKALNGERVERRLAGIFGAPTIVVRASLVCERAYLARKMRTFLEITYLRTFGWPARRKNDHVE